MQAEQRQFTEYHITVEAMPGIVLVRRAARGALRVSLLQPFLHKSTSAHPYSPCTSFSFASNFTKIRSHFALSRHARHEPHVQRLYGSSGGSAVSS
jgi:hypothetical protein